jgi:hypothetical protein
MSDKLIRATTGFLERRTNRRGFLVRATAVGTALAVAPVRYLLEPEEAMAIVTPFNGQCGSNQLCRKSQYTEFCCSIGDWGKNKCPSYAFKAGWWKCNGYNGVALCKKEGHRYYIDCNLKPNHSCTCKCTRNKCRYRRTCCNHVRYPGCNHHIQPSDVRVVCRIVKCRNPGHVYPGQCSVHGGARDDHSCCHEAACHCGKCGCPHCSTSREHCGEDT